MKCKICNQENRVSFKGIVLNKYRIRYYYCTKCNFLQTEDPFWLKESYMESINISDTGYMKRNSELLGKIIILLNLFFDKNKKYLDCAGGYGVFVRCMRDIGFDFYWDDIFTDNLFARGFEYSKIDHIEAITTFESFEHFVNPIKEIESMLSISKNIIFSTELLPTSIPRPNEWWYYGLEHGQHVSIYSKNTLMFIAKKYNLNYINLGNLHIFTKKNISKFGINVLKLSKFGLHKLLEKTMKSKTWDDYLLIKNNK